MSEIYKNPAAAAEAMKREPYYTPEEWQKYNGLREKGIHPSAAVEAVEAVPQTKEEKYDEIVKKAKKPVLTDKARAFYTDEEIAKFSDKDIDLINDFLGRFNNPKPRG